MPRPPIRRQGRVRLGVLALALGGVRVHLRMRRLRGLRPRPRSSPVPAELRHLPHLAQAGSSADASAPTSTQRSPRRAPTAWTPTPSRAWSSSRSPTRAGSRRAFRTSPTSTCPPSRHRAGRRGRRGVRRQRRGDRARSRRSCRPISCSPSGGGAVTPSRRPARPGPPVPILDDALAGKDANFIEQQIVDPNSQIAQGYGPDVMPQDFGPSPTPQDIKGLVDYLMQNVGGATADQRTRPGRTVAPRPARPRGRRSRA